jgi:hypothetical protein
MRKTLRVMRWTRLWLPVISLILILTACGASGGAGKLLVWTGAGVSPDQKTAATPGQLAYLDGDGKLEPVLDIPAEAEGVSACGETATSPDGRHFALMVNVPQGGRDGGTLYQITDGGKPVEVGPAHALSCTGNGTFQYSLDSKQLAYIDYSEPANNAEYASGTLRIFSTDQPKQIASYDNVGAFHLGSDSAEFLQYYASNQNNVDEIAVMIYSNTAANEIATLFADVNCRYTGAAISPAGGKLAILVGHRCTNAGTNWQLYTVNRDGGDLTLAMSASQGGGFFPNARTASLTTGAEDQFILFTSADGIARDTASLYSASMQSLAVDQLTTLITRGAWMQHYTPRAYTVSDNATPLFSPNRRWWGLVVADTSNPTTLNIIDLTATTKSPLTAVADRNQNISSMIFAPDSSSVYFVVGGHDGAENTLSRMSLPDGKVTAITAGTFGGGVIAPDGSALALTVWQKAADTRETLYQNLALVNPSDGSITKTLFQGVVYKADGTTVDGLKFAVPLTYRR